MIPLLAIAAAKTNGETHSAVRFFHSNAWNSFNGQYDHISFYSHGYLSSEKFDYRLPFFAKVPSPTNTSYNEDMQSIMDEEIFYAKHTRLDYWVFDTYCTFALNCNTNSAYCAEYLKIAPHYSSGDPAYG